MPIITLTSDFGSKSFGIASLKGQLMRACSSVRIIDISHTIEARDNITTAYSIKNASKKFPDYAIHFTNINIKEGNNRYLILERKKQFYICPDNGMASIMFPDEDYKAYVLQGLEVEFSYKQLHNKLAEIIAFAEHDSDITKFGIETNSYMKAISQRAGINGNIIRASVIFVDMYGNLILNISKELFNSFVQENDFKISARSASFDSIGIHYSDVVPGEIVCLFNEADLLEIAQNSSSASDSLGLKSGDMFIIERYIKNDY